MILIDNPDKFAEYQEVDGDGLRVATEDGWVVIAVLNTQKVDKHIVSNPMYDQSGYQTGTSSSEQSFVINQPRYLLGLTRDQAMNDLREQNKGLRDTCDHHMSTSHNLGVRVKDLEKSIVDAERRSITAKENAEKYQKALSDSDANRGRMEDTLGKLRMALGDIKFKEIIG